MIRKTSKKLIQNAKVVGRRGLDLSSNIFEPLEKKTKKLSRDKAIERARATIALSPKDINQMSEEDIEIIVASEEAKIIQEIKDKGLFAAMAALGISFFG